MNSIGKVVGGEFVEFANNGTKYINGAIEKTDYEQLVNKPSINGITLSGNKTSTDLGLVYQGDTINIQATL
ncbi:MAG: hypothetical protein HFG89_00250 [Dorea sp.]|jgi:hypothetical protein|nr:hypothetical protein [Dorea sp.]